MNKAILMGRLTKDPEVRYSQGDNSLAIANYTLAVDRRGRRSGQQSSPDQPTADFIPCVAFGKSAEFAEKYFHKGIKIVVSGRIQTRNYTNKEGNKVYVTEIVVEDQEFAESKNASSSQSSYGAPSASGAGAADAPADTGSGAGAGAGGDDGGFFNIPDGIEDELPFA